MSEQNQGFRPSLPFIPLDEAVVFPYTVVTLPLDEETAAAAEHADANGHLVLLGVRHEDGQLSKIATIGRIEQLGKLPSGGSGVVVRGLHRAELDEQVQNAPFERYAYTERQDRFVRTPELEALMEEVHASIQTVLDMRPGMPQDIKNFVRSIDDPGHLADNTGYSPDYTFAERLDLLETLDVGERLAKVRDIYRKQIALMEVQQRIRQEVQEGANKQQREFYLRQQMKAIQKELGEDDTEADELDALREKLAAAKLSEAARKEADREINRLSRMSGSSPEYQMVRTYLEWLAELPWNAPSGGTIDVPYAREVLDADHYGLEKIKERILEYLAVKARRAAIAEELGDTGPSREPILLFVGPPGVGKTSLGQSIAKSLGRQFVRMSLGGVRDEAELRGFRRTYIGSQPGRIIQELRRAGTSDPVVLLDEVDKIGQDYRGDPSAALLEVLDPEQNSTFTDHYLNLPFDLSKVLFIATANDLSTIPPALRDRMEIIELSGYIEDEKVRIAQQHLLPKQLRASGLKAVEVTVQETAIREIVRHYTREAGVRNLERVLGGVLRKVTRKLAEDDTETRKGDKTNQLDGSVSVSPGLLVSESAGLNGSVSPGLPAYRAPAPTVIVTPEFVREALGRQRFHNEVKERIDQPGISTGLVWTPVGGDIIFVEASVITGSRELKITGQLGDVMKESAEAALTYIRSRAETLGIDPGFFDTHTIHIHVPAGAQPKDGPSAGITMATALASAATGRLVRDDVAMTGEISLRGRVLPIGGIKEKALGAHRAGIRTIILPKRNEEELDELPKEVFDELTFVPVETLDEVLAAALLPHPTATMTNLLAADGLAAESGSETVTTYS